MEEQEPNALKEDPRDFALWKANKPGEDTVVGLALGPRAPGLAHRVLGDGRGGARPEFELHGGGLDLVFPHHENELAQSSALGHGFARIWTHNGMLEFGGEKMSKSLGNDVSIRNVLDTWGREVALLFFLTAHWRKPIDFTDATLEQAKAQWQSFQQTIYEAKPPQPTVGWDAFEAALDDDFNTPEALAVLHEWRRASELDLLNRGLSIFGLGFVPRQAAATRCGRSSTSGRRRGRRRTSQRSDELRDRIARARLGRPGRPGRPDARAEMTREQVYGRRPVREALRGRREVLELWATERAVKARGLAARDRSAQGAGEARAGHLGGGRHPRPPGRARVVRAVQVRRRLRARRDRPTAARLPRPGERPAEPRRGLPKRRGRGRDRRRRPVARLRARDRRRSAARPRARSSICRSRS